MPVPEGRLRILFSARTLFNLEEAHKLFLKDPANPQEYIEYMRENEDKPLDAGPLLRLYQICERINHYSDELGYRPFNIGVCSKDDPVSQRRILNSLGQDYIEDAAFHSQPHGGAGYRREWIRRYFNNQVQPSVFFTCNPEDAQMAVDDGLAAAQILIPEGASYDVLKDGETFDWWFDLDAVAWGSSAEVEFKKNGKDAFLKKEWSRRKSPIERGPFTAPLITLSQIVRDLKDKGIASPLQTHACTARGGKAMMRASNTMQHYGIEFAQSHFMAGESKSDLFNIVRADGGADLFLDDQIGHLEPLLVDGHTACGRVPYSVDSAIRKYEAKLANKLK